MSTPTKPTLSVFLHVDDYRKASQIDVTNFCTTIDQELHEDPARDVPLTEIRHYKEKVSHSPRELHDAGSVMTLVLGQYGT